MTEITMDSRVGSAEIASGKAARVAAWQPQARFDGVVKVPSDQFSQAQLPADEAKLTARAEGIEITSEQAFLDCLGRVLQRHACDGSGCALVLVEVCSKGPARLSGDAAVAAMLRIGDSIRESDSVTRIGERRYAVILEQIESLCDVRDCVRRFRSALEQPPLLQDLSEIRLGARMGLALYAGGDADAATLLRNASDTLSSAGRAFGSSRS